MQKRIACSPFLGISVTPESRTPLHRQLCERLRESILEGLLPPGSGVPSSRALANDLGLSRNTVINAYEQLVAEGYLVSRVGSGTRVAADLPRKLIQARSKGTPVPPHGLGRRTLSKRGRKIAAGTITVGDNWEKPKPFQPGVPATEDFPFKIWGRITARRLRTSLSELSNYGNPAGFMPLRHEIASYLRATRGVRCEPHQVIIVAGAMQGFDLVARVLLDPNDAVWVEDPGYRAAPAVLRMNGARVVSVPVDREGLDVAAGAARCPSAKLAIVTPSHQYPLGVTMGLARRQALIKWAQTAGAWILEGDYDGEFRYTGQPMPPLQSLDDTGRVMYLGTFSKVTFPSLRLGYLVAPPDLVDSFIVGRALLNRYSPALEQATLADFMAEGHFARHLRHMRNAYRRKRDLFLRELAEELGGLLDVQPSTGGMHLVGFLPKAYRDSLVSSRLLAQGIVAPALSSHSLRKSKWNGLVLGYAGIRAAQIRPGVEILARTLYRDLVD